MKRDKTKCIRQDRMHKLPDKKSKQSPMDLMSETNIYDLEVHGFLWTLLNRFLSFSLTQFNLIMHLKTFAKYFEKLIFIAPYKSINKQQIDLENRPKCDKNTNSDTMFFL